MQVGYLGVGNMGQPMAGKLLDGGHGLVVFDISEAAMEPLLLRQARRAGSPKDVGDQCEIVVVSLPTLAAFRAAVLGPEGLAAGQAMKVLLNTCTVGVPFLRGGRSARGNAVGDGVWRARGDREGAAADLTMGTDPDDCWR